MKGGNQHCQTRIQEATIPTFEKPITTKTKNIKMSASTTIANRTALVFGASGITGWAILREALEYPTATTFSRVIGLTNRPLDRSKSFLPDDSRLALVPGIDLTASVDDVIAKLAEIDGIEDVTDVYFAGIVSLPFKQ